MSLSTAGGIIKAALLGMFLCLPFSYVHAEASAVTSVCRDAKILAGDLEKEQQTFQSLVTQLEEVINGSASVSVGVIELQALLSGKDGEALPTSWPEVISCEDLQQSYTKNRASLIWQKEHLSQLRNLYWWAQSSVVRSAILSVWRSRQRLLQHEQELNNQLQNLPSVTLQTKIEALHSNLQAQRIAFFRLLPKLSEGINYHNVSEWIVLWRQSLRLIYEHQLPETDELPAGIQSIVVDHYRIAELDQLVMSNVVNNIRAWLWKKHQSSFARARQASADSDQQLLLDEVFAVRNILRWLYVDATVDFRQSGPGNNPVVWRFFQGFEYLFGLLSFFLLALVASKSKKPAADIQAFYVLKLRRQRGYAQVSRITLTISLMLPWVIGWLGLEYMESLFASYDLPLLLPLLSFARLYIVYGLLRLFGGWLLSRVNQQASVFQNEQQILLAERQTKQAAAIVILPWLLMDLVKLAIGPSLMLGIFDWITLFALWFAVGFLLGPWQREFILALQTFFPQRLDNLVERILNSVAFILLAPLFVPLFLVAVLVDFSQRFG
ncbi:EscU/YscU/HrcU family type III secretion system export apparatus switch protein [Oceanicoccus sp. KOV_DT_Chl]|uniref:EscU/YscU/HrcU family type III secretion system export apparatus switch protein n=1 Tax=Oceanicoccus sp. KOV_DT_Chl TaxID=1904639 RepID=UPI0011AF1EEE|nr:EscU/YscU/HrcU family type III secretion system export apparatus switch protein [Oceanicoccus sp. KOV_DT_Chl]